MSTILYPSPIVGPIHSRRLGISLGVNVNPSDGKICTFDCIYCEVGYNRNRHTTSPRPIRLRNVYYPNAKVSVLTNSTLAIRPDVHRALMLVDNNIMKLDTVDPIYINNVDRPVSPAYDVERIIKEMQSFNGHVIIQTIFMNGTDDLGRDVSNTSDRFVEPWLATMRQIRPSEVMIYTIDRETPCPTLRKATHEELNTIRDRVAAEGFNCIAAY